jgi:hypothetical protein
MGFTDKLSKSSHIMSFADARSLKQKNLLGEVIPETRVDRRRTSRRRNHEFWTCTLNDSSRSINGQRRSFRRRDLCCS